MYSKESEALCALTTHHRVGGPYYEFMKIDSSPCIEKACEEQHTVMKLCYGVTPHLEYEGNLSP